MDDFEAKKALKNFKFTDNDFIKLDIFVNELLKFNSRYNLISKNTEKSIWSRHILDSAQLLNFFSTKKEAKLVDF